MPATEVGDKRQAAREVIDVLHDISVILVLLTPSLWSPSMSNRTLTVNRTQN